MLMQYYCVLCTAPDSQPSHGAKLGDCKSRHDDSYDFAHVHDEHVTSASCSHMTRWLFLICATGAVCSRTS